MPSDGEVPWFSDDLRACVCARVFFYPLHLLCPFLPTVPCSDHYIISSFTICLLPNKYYVSMLFLHDYRKT